MAASSNPNWWGPMFHRIDLDDPGGVVGLDGRERDKLVGMALDMCEARGVTKVWFTYFSRRLGNCIVTFDRELHTQPVAQIPEENLPDVPLG